MSDPFQFSDQEREATIDGLPKLFVDGVQYFNEKDFFECHEVLEEMWRHARGEKSRFYQGLIQAAVCLYHWSNGNFDGARRLAQTALEKLDGLPDIMMRLRLVDFRTTFKNLVQPLVENRPDLGPIDPRACPELVLMPGS